jgi:hypothetical protein
VTAPTTRVITMTVCKIEADMHNVTPVGGPERFIAGHIWIEATSGEEFHRWQLRTGQRCWIGDIVNVVMYEPDLSQRASTGLTPPPIDKREPA